MSNDKSDSAIYRTEFQCGNCLGQIETEFDDPEESFSVECPHCNAFYPAVHVR